MLPEKLVPIHGVSPATNAGAVNGARISVKGFHKLYAVVHVTQGNAAQSTIALQESTSIAGGGEQAVANTQRIWSNLDVAAARRLVERTSAINYQLDAGLASKIVVFEIDPAKLSAGFDCVRCIAGASDVGNIVSIMYYGVPRYESRVLTQPDPGVD